MDLLLLGIGDKCGLEVVGRSEGVDMPALESLREELARSPGSRSGNWLRIRGGIEVGTEEMRQDWRAWMRYIPSENSWRFNDPRSVLSMSFLDSSIQRSNQAQYLNERSTDKRT